MAGLDITQQVEKLIASASRIKSSTQKLQEQTREVAEWLADNLPEGDLPRDYSIGVISSDRWGDGYFLFLESEKDDRDWDSPEEPHGCLNSTGVPYLWGDYNCPGPELPDRKVCLKFAADLKTGWIEEVSAMMSKRADTNESAIQVLQVAGTALEGTSRS